MIERIRSLAGRQVEEITEKEQEKKKKKTDDNLRDL